MHILLAASPGISEYATSKCLDSIESGPAEVEYSYLHGNNILKSAVLKRWPNALERSYRSRSEAKRLLDDIDHLVFLWDGNGLTELLFDARVRKKPTKVFPIEVTRVVNRKLTDKYDVYIGRGSPWGNPFAISQGDGPDRNEVIERYREYFNEKLETDVKFKNGILALRGMRLACYCKPEACHGDIIAEYLDGPKSREAETQPTPDTPPIQGHE